MKQLYNNTGFWVGIFHLVFWIYGVIAYIVNLFKFLFCDFESPWRDEIVHGIGVFLFFPSYITVWL